MRWPATNLEARRGSAAGRPSVGAKSILLAALVVAAWSGVGDAHEERLLVGRVESLERARKLLVVADAQGGERRRLEVGPETEVIACGTRGGLTVLHAGAMVRVKYLDRAGGGSEAQSILMLGSSR